MTQQSLETLKELSKIVHKAAPKKYVATFNIYFVIVNLQEIIDDDDDDDSNIEYKNATDYFLQAFREGLENI